MNSEPLKCRWIKRASLPGLLESASALLLLLLLAFDEVDESDGDDVTTMETPGDGGGFTKKKKNSFLVNIYESRINLIKLITLQNNKKLFLLTWKWEDSIRLSQPQNTINLKWQKLHRTYLG